MTVLSSDAETSDCPSLENPTERTAAMCALSNVDSPLTVGIHRRMVRSLEAEASRFPEGAAATASTAALCPTKRKARSCSLKFHTITHESAPPETSCFMFGLKQTEVMASLWPRKARSSAGSAGVAAATEAAMASGDGGKRARGLDGRLLCVRAGEEGQGWNRTAPGWFFFFLQL